MENKRIIMGSDHAGFGLKLKVKAHLEARGFEVTDVGTHTPESSTTPSTPTRSARPLPPGRPTWASWSAVRA